MSHITCQRCGKTTKDSTTANAARWAWPFGSSSMRPECYDGLQRLRENHLLTWPAKYRAWMAKGKK